MDCAFCLHSIEGSAVVRSAGDASYVRCNGCRSIVLVPLPIRETNAPFEGMDAVARQERSDDVREEYFRRRVDLLERFAPKRGRLLDVGCSSGRLLLEARQRGWQIEGLELSAALADAARRRNPGVTIHQTDFAEGPALAAASFDALVAIDVIEHVLSPAAFMRRAREALRPGGVLLLQTPNALSLRARLHGARWNMLLPEYHFHLPSAAGLRRALERENLRVLHLSTASGSGHERGARHVIAAAQQALLGMGKLGNALVVVAQRA